VADFGNDFLDAPGHPITIFIPVEDFTWLDKDKRVKWTNCHPSKDISGDDIRKSAREVLNKFPGSEQLLAELDQFLQSIKL
jgi:hypothetical protein